MKNNAKNNGFILPLILTFIVGIFYVLKTGAKNAFQLAEFRLLSLKVSKPTGLLIPIEIIVEVANPTPNVLPVTNYKVEVYHNAKLLTTSNIGSVTIPANGKVVNKVVFDTPYLAILNMAIPMAGIETSVELTLKNNVTIKIYANVLNQQLVKEIKY